MTAERMDIISLPLVGDLDVTTVPALRSYLDARIDAGCRRVILNLARTTYVDSLGMGLILSMTRRLHELGGRFSLANVSDQIYRAMCICRLVDYVPVRRSAAPSQVPALDPSVRPRWRATIRVVPERLSQVRGRLGELLGKTELPAPEVFDLKLAAGEALGNAIDHTCGDCVLLIVTTFLDRVVIEVTDCGEGFELAADEEPPTHRDQGVSGAVLERGRGIRLMRMLVDSVEIHRRPNGVGTVVRLVKLFIPCASV